MQVMEHLQKHKELKMLDQQLDNYQQLHVQMKYSWDGTQIQQVEQKLMKMR